MTIKDEKRISRRQFIKSTAGIAAVSTTGAILSCKKKTGSSDSTSALPTRVLGKTGLNISTLSFGGGSQFLKNKNGEWEPMLERAIDIGINLFDTASNYKFGAVMCSEERLGVILPKYRDKVIISTKFDSRNPDEAMKEFETSLNYMNTDYVDILMIHSIGPSDDINALEKGVYKKMQQLKDEGITRFIGFSSMDSAEKSKELLEKLDIDVCILAMNPTQYGHFAQIALPVAREKNVGVIAMKVMRNIVGKEATAKELMNYALSQQGVASAVIGHYKMETFEENIKLVKEFAANESVKLQNLELENRLAHLAGPHALCWARSDYYDGKMC